MGNKDFMMVSVIGPPGVEKSIIINELYGFDGTSLGESFLSGLVDVFDCNHDVCLNVSIIYFLGYLVYINSLYLYFNQFKTPLFN